MGVATFVGKEGDATPFTQVTVENISAELHKLGYQCRGFETLYNGHTGRPLEAQIFFGPTYYQRLRHMVDDKIHSRARGPHQILTRQPMEGRARRRPALWRDGARLHHCARRREFPQGAPHDAQRRVPRSRVRYVRSTRCRGLEETDVPLPSVRRE